jgi:D-serine deaminase-like pyridoxal phosphate-dependent protein
MSKLDWFEVDDSSQIDSPALLVYPDNIEYNINRMLYQGGNADRLFPHVKTVKMPEVVQLLMAKGITKFKCATIAEAEMLGMVGAKQALLAYQPFGPKIDRLLAVKNKFPGTNYATLVDNKQNARTIAESCVSSNVCLDIYIDINMGMNRTGVKPNEEAVELYRYCESLDGISIKGIHGYDGHLRNQDFNQRKKDCDIAFEPLSDIIDQLEMTSKTKPIVVVGGTPTFPIHATRQGVYLSPGTTVLWDFGYETILEEQDYRFGALVLTRIISKLPNNQLCLDLGHKSVAAENPFPRVHFLNLQEAVEVSQSEEHLVVQVADSSEIPLGKILYGVPKHICPTVALYERANVIKAHQKIDEWKVIARDRKITI